ncbi:uncharacterized protein LOC124260940 isoform X1 [Haliotis rubra]|uniref:uncharacterized protein LOC124260940 isoform X1 n=1 Tax=Haliotis rubra TaxID=36100 RepID=UPI001EE51748|nr:uncharacterized protein LOC124260940 isoform X1 [Haliotis rubra]
MNTKPRASMSSSKLTDILEPLKTFGWDTYVQTTDEYERIDFDDAELEVLLDEVTCTTSGLKYLPTGQIGPRESSTQLVFCSNYDNRTDHDHQHRFTAQKVTHATAEVQLTEGFTSGNDVGFSIDIPEPVRKATAGFGRQMVIRSKTTHTVQNELAWSIDSNVLAPKNARTVARMEVKEETFESDFEVKVTLTGKVKIRISRDGEFVKMVQNKIGTILGDRLPGKDKSNPLTDKNSATWQVKGRVRFNYGISQNVEVSQVHVSNIKGAVITSHQVH